MQAIVDESRKWVGTRFHHQGRVRKTTYSTGGCDCLGLLVGVAGALKLRSRQEGVLLASLDELHYGRIPDGKRLRQMLESHLLLLENEEAQPGDIALFRLDRNTQHVGILSDYSVGGLGVIHAYAPMQSVVEHRLDETWKEKIAGVFRVAEVDQKL